MSLCSHWSCPWRYEVHHETCLCCCRRTDLACRSLGPAEKAAGGLLPGLGNGKHQLLKNMDSLLQVTLTQGKIQYFTGISSQKQSSKNLPTRLQLFWLHLRLLHRMLRLVIEGRVVVVLVLVGLVQSLRLISWWDWGIKVEHLRVNKDHIVVKPEPEERSQAHYPLFPQ